jgi:hypothetical protein
MKPRLVMRAIKGGRKRVELYIEELECQLEKLYREFRRDVVVVAAFPDGRRVEIPSVIMRLYGKYYIHPGYEHQHLDLSDVYIEDVLVQDTMTSIREVQCGADVVARNLVAYVLRRGDMPRRKLMKLLYLVDRELYMRRGYTVFRWKLYRYGPLSRGVFDALDELEDADAAEMYVTDDAVMYRLLQPLPEPPDEVKEAADRVLDTWASRSLDELAEYVNNLEEVRDAWPGKPLLQ